MDMIPFLIVSLLAPLAGPPRTQQVLNVPLKGNIVRSVAVAPDGKNVAVAAADRTVRHWDVLARLERTPIKVSAPVSEMALAPDAKRLAVLTNSLEMWEPESGKRLTSFSEVTANLLAYSVDGKLVIASHRAKLLSADTGEVQVEMPEQAGWQNTCLAFSPDGTRIAAGDLAGNVWVWDTASATLKLRRKVHVNRVTGIGFIDDGALLVSGGQDGKMTFWDMKSGREVGAMVPHGAGAGKGIAGLVCSLDGKLIVTAGAGDGTIKLWEGASGRLRAALVDRTITWTSLALALDGSTLAAGGKRGQDGVAMAWRLYATEPRFTSQVRPALWTELAGDASSAYHAMLTLASQPREAVAFLSPRMRPVVLDPAMRMECDALIAVLDDETVAVRDDAYHKLEVMSPWIESHLKKALATAKTLELQRRLQTLITKVGGSTLPLLRAVEALEHAPGPEARKLLRRIAAGEPDARVTREARQALERCERLESLR